jgi:hypothetical protein
MNTTVKTPDMIAQAIAQYNAPEAVIAKIQTEYLPLSVKEHGIDKVTGARKEVKRLRVSIESKRKELKADALAFGKAVDGEAKRLTGLIEPVEQHLQEEEDVYEAGKAMEKRIKLEAQQRKTQERIDRLTAAGSTQVDLLSVQSLTDDAFALMLTDVEKAAEARRIEAERLEAIRLEEQARQAEELRIRAEELEAERQAMREQQAQETAERERLAAIEADRLQREREEQAAARAEQQRILDEERAALAAERDRLAKEAAAATTAEDARKAEWDRLAAIQRKRIRDEEEAENLRAWNEEQARLRAEEHARQEALKPEILKVETFCHRLQEHAHEILKVLDVKWHANAMRCVEACCAEVTEMVARR